MNYSLQNLSSQYESRVNVAGFIDNTELPPLPPVIKEYVSCCPAGFEEATIMSLLPILGTLGSKLRARFLDGRMHAPSFMTCISGESQSGKSFIGGLSTDCLRLIDSVDKVGYELQDEYKNKRATYERLLGRSAKNNLEAPVDPKPIIRLEPPKPSSSKLLMRMSNARGLHLFSVSEELDVLVGALRGVCTDTSVLIRCAFDNSVTGQDYVKDDTFSGKVQICWNMLFSGTPSQVSSFFTPKAVENGMCSRFIITRVPVRRYEIPTPWKQLSEKQRAIVEPALQRLNDISVRCVLQHDKEGNEQVSYEPCDDYVVNLGWLNNYLHKWEDELLNLAKQADDRRVDMTYKRPVVTAFRAGMLAWFLYGEKDTPAIRRKVCQFAHWVACTMLSNHLEYTKDINISMAKMYYPELYAALPAEFTLQQLEAAKKQCNVHSKNKQVLLKWRNYDKSIVEVTAAESAEGASGTERKFAKTIKS